jgi:Family of unknown function (DUF6328)
VTIEQPGEHKRWDPDRAETETERLDRNWASLLQELRVAQTGVQLLTGFLLVLPFQERFTQLDSAMRVVYLITVSSSLVATALLVGPVGMHRVLFRQHRLDTLVSTSHAYALAGLLLLGVALAGVAIMVFYLVAGTTAAWIAGACMLIAAILFWLLVPLRARKDAP